MELTNSKDLTLEKIKVLLYGPPGSGKTHAAATIDPACPVDTIAETSTPLSKTLWMLFDPGGLDGFLERNIVVDKVLDLSSLSGVPLMRALNGAVETARKLVADKEVEYIVIDTLTSMNNRIRAYWEDQISEQVATRKVSEKKAGMETAMRTKQTHMQFATSLDGIPASIIIICHAKAEMDFGKTTTHKASTDLPGFSGIKPDISGSAANHYVGESSLILPTFCERVNGKDQYWFYPNGKGVDGTGGFSAKNRFKHTLNKKIKADLRDVFSTIRNGGTNG